MDPPTAVGPTPAAQPMDDLFFLETPAPTMAPTLRIAPTRPPVNMFGMPSRGMNPVARIVNYIFIFGAVVGIVVTALLTRRGRGRRSMTPEERLQLRLQQMAFENPEQYQEYLRERQRSRRRRRRREPMSEETMAQRREYFEKYFQMHKVETTISQDNFVPDSNFALNSSSSSDNDSECNDDRDENDPSSAFKPVPTTTIASKRRSSANNDNSIRSRVSIRDDDAELVSAELGKRGGGEGGGQSPGRRSSLLRRLSSSVFFKTEGGDGEPSSQRRSILQRIVSPTASSDDNDDEKKLPVVCRLPDRESRNQPPVVSNLCAICLCPYEVGETVAWSTNSDCPHAFHADCVVDYLAYQGDEIRSDEQDDSETGNTESSSHHPCPCCRRSFCVITPSSLIEEEEM